MQFKWMLAILFGTVALAPVGVHAQDAPKTGAPAQEQAGFLGGQLDIGLSGFPTFTSASTGNGVKQNPSNAYGGMLEGRLIFSPLVGVELAYSYSRTNQSYTPIAGACGLVCQTPPTAITAFSNTIAGNYIVSRKIGNLSPFLVGGIGFYITVPGATPYGNSTSIRAAYDGGGGLDWNLTSHLGARLQVRDNFYHAPKISSIFPATGVLTSTVDPMGGVYYRF